MEIKGIHKHITDEELETRVLESLMCPICKTRGHISVWDRKTGYCLDTGLWVELM